MITTLLALAGVIFAAGIFVGYLLSAPEYSGKTSAHFNGKKFRNPGEARAKGFKDLVKWAWNRDQGPWQEIEDVEQYKVIADVPDSIVRVYFVNHSTFLIQARGINILTDPIWSKRASPFSWAGPKRMRPPGIRFEDLPPIDLILISHNHYDHLDVSTLKKLDKNYNPRIITPLGVSKYLNNKGLDYTAELDWWGKQDITDRITVHCVPAQHFSGRGFFDRDKTLWAGYVIQVAESHVYFAGDTGYSPFFKEIGKRFSPINVALLPIGAYLPRWFMSPVHTSPSDAVKAHFDLNAEKSFGIHYRTFPLGDDGMKEPEKDLRKAKDSYAGVDFMLLEEGRHIDIPVNE